jgi:pimeloyl-ACP methyl ester carboxylesterase
VIVELRGAAGNAIAGERAGPWPAARHVLLAHGGGQTRHAWGGARRALAAAHWTALAVDARGHGDSAWVEPGAYAFEDFGADMAAVTAALTREAGTPPVVVGASLGGLSGLLAIGEMGAPARALVLVDVTPNLDRGGVAKIQGFMGERAAEGFGTLEEAADAVARYLPHRPRPRSLEGLRKNLRLGPDGRWRWHWDPRFLAGPRSINHGHETIEARFEAAARALRLPVLLVRGAESELVGEDEARRFLALAPHAEVVDVGAARHMVAGDANDAFVGAVSAFLARLESRNS